MTTAPITSEAIEVANVDLSDDAISALAALLVEVATRDSEEAQE